MKGKTSRRAWAVIKWFLPVAGMAGLLLMSRIIIVRRICAVIAFLSLIAWLIVKAEKASGLRDLFSKLAPLLPPAAYTAAGMEGMESLADFLNRVTDWAGLPVELDGQASAYIFLIALYLPINWWANRDRTTLGKNRENSDPMLREKTVAEKRDAFCDDLLLRLKKINQDTDWNAGYYAPIEAEVEAGTGDHHRKRYPDLLKCMKKIRHNGKVYLVLGEPGSGKSVSLRKLCMDLLGESKESGKIPVYINLKEWTEPWTLDNRPTPQDLVSFVRQTLRQGIDVFSDDFVDNYFEPMLKNGWWYFVFDSFDEMPCLMGRENCGELIAHISNLLSNFLTSPGQSGGIIASRLNKAPTQALGAESTLFLREFDDRRIVIMLDKYLNHGEEVAKKLFDGTREHLATLCRNPFSLTLLINYIREKGVIFPETQMDLYQNFVEERLKRCRERLEKAGLTAEDIRDAARELADLMQEEQTLEYPISRLIPTERWKTVLDILKYARICRFSEQQDAVSFVHRRFQEFLLVECILAGQREIRPEEYEGITTGAGLRDALVLYCEVAEKEKAAKIAEYCWGKVQKNIGSRTYIGNPGCLELTNTLYFMTEAFRNRPDAVENFRDEFEKMVEDNLDRKTDSLVLLAVVNSMALFDGNHLQRIVLRIFEMNIRWLQDAIMKNCRSIKSLDSSIEIRFARYFSGMSLNEFLNRFEIYVPQ